MTDDDDDHRDRIDFPMAGAQIVVLLKRLELSKPLPYQGSALPTELQQHPKTPIERVYEDMVAMPRIELGTSGL
jgi:hypothetical protein